MSVIKGGDLMLFVTVDGAKKSIGFATNHTLNISAETKETSSKDSGGKWQSSEVGILSWSCSSENLYSNDQEGIGYEELFEMMIAREPITGVFAIEGSSTDLDKNKLGTVPTDGWKAKADSGLTGKMYITNLDLNAPNGDNATFKVDFTGIGELKKVATK